MPEKSIPMNPAIASWEYGRHRAELDAGAEVAGLRRIHEAAGRLADAAEDFFLLMDDPVRKKALRKAWQRYVEVVREVKGP